MRMMCLRLLRGIRSGHASVDPMVAVIIPLFTLYNPSVGGSALFLGRFFVDERLLEAGPRELGCKAFLKFPQLPLNS